LNATYRKDRAIGSGTLATVYEGWDEQLGRPVAIKELSTRFAEDPRLLELFLAEAQKMAAFSHAHILALHCVDQSHETPWLIMELADGSLKERIDQGPTQPEPAVKILRQALLGLGEIHRRGLVHRNLKPENVFRCGDTYKVGDFGLTRSEDDPTMILSLPKYVAPEGLKEAGTLGPASDLYSLGLVIYELLLGRQRYLEEVAKFLRSQGGEPGDSAVPAESENQTWFQLHLSAEELPPLHSLDATLPEALSAIVGKMIRKDPGQRYASCAEVLADLKRFEGDHDDEGDEPTVPISKVSSAGSGRRPLRIAALAAGVLVLLLILVVVLLPTTAVRVDVTSEPPGAQVLVGGKVLGETPWEDVLVKIGTELVLRLDGYEDAAVVLTSAEQKVLHADLVRRAVAMEMTSEPTGATVRAAGEELGKTPLEVEVDPAVELSFELAGFETATATPDPEQGRLHVVLQPLPFAAERVSDAASLARELLRLSTDDGELRLTLEGISAPSPIRLAIGTPLQFALESDRAAFAVLFYLTSDGTLTCLYPYPALPVVELRPGERRLLPAPEEGIRFTATPPAGRDFVFLFAAPSPPMPPAGEPSLPGERAVYPLRLGEASNPAVAFAGWLAELRRQDPAATRLVALEVEISEQRLGM